MMSRESELRAMAARILGDLRDVPFQEALELIEDAASEDCYSATVAALGYDPLDEAKRSVFARRDET
jgi:hypothetical protein